METREQVFEQLIKEKLGLLRGTAMRILGSPADVDDAVQEALMTIVSQTLSVPEVQTNLRMVRITSPMRFVGGTRAASNE